MHWLHVGEAEEVHTPSVLLYGLVVLLHQQSARLVHVRPHVEIQVAALLKSLLANRTSERLYVRVSPHMLAKVDGLRKALGANDAFERLDFCMSAQVLIQARLLGERFAAEPADERSDAAVHAHMLMEAADLRETFGTNRTLVRFHFCVHDAFVFIVLGTVEETQPASEAWECNFMSIEVLSCPIG